MNILLSLIILPLYVSMPDFPFLCLMGQSFLWAHFPLYFSFSNPSLLLQLLKLYFIKCKYYNQKSIKILFHWGNFILFQWNWSCLIKNIGQQWGWCWKLWVRFLNSSLGKWRTSWVWRVFCHPLHKRVSSAMLYSIGWLFSLQATISDLLMNGYKWGRS